MPRIALMSDFWRDLLSISSMVISIVGFVLTVISLVYAIKQIWKTQSAADAALMAARQAVEESRNSFARYVLSNALRYFSEAKVYVSNNLWDKASLRLNDLADQVAQLGNVDPEWKQISTELRRWAEAVGRYPSQKVEFSYKKWGDFTRKVQEKIDQQHDPFKVLKAGATK